MSSRPQGPTSRRLGQQHPRGISWKNTRTRNHVRLPRRRGGRGLPRRGRIQSRIPGRAPWWGRTVPDRQAQVVDTRRRHRGRGHTYTGRTCIPISAGRNRGARSPTRDGRDRPAVASGQGGEHRPLEYQQREIPQKHPARRGRIPHKSGIPHRRAPPGERRDEVGHTPTKGCWPQAGRSHWRRPSPIFSTY